MTKTLSNYETSILNLHVELQHLPEFHPDYEKKQEQLSRQRTAWSKKLMLNVRVAQNETIPWTDEELGMVTIPMEKKAASGYNQTGDYIFEILNDRASLWAGCVWNARAQHGSAVAWWGVIYTLRSLKRTTGAGSKLNSSGFRKIPGLIYSY